jgi:hypothetical protein
VLNLYYVPVVPVEHLQLESVEVGFGVGVLGEPGPEIDYLGDGDCHQLAGELRAGLEGVKDAGEELAPIPGSHPSLLLLHLGRGGERHRDRECRTSKLN